MPEQNWISTSTNMVRTVKSIIEGYRMGPNRALAQDPVQNSLDARVASPARVAYTLHRRQIGEGADVVLLTVTDSHTTGLRGDPLTPEGLQARAAATGEMQLNPDENWAAWEAMGYTKTGEEDLGSRGQGKAAFLYHSVHATRFLANGVPVERMAILYDTLLSDGTYRFGARLARPDDVVLAPPLEGDDARAAIASTWSLPDTDMEVPLRLEPLREVGTRVIVPFLTQAAVDAFESGEIQRWLERCWWRAIQTMKLAITVGWEGEEPTPIGVPSWWTDEPWRNGCERCRRTENIQVPGTEYKVKRVVLFHDPALEVDEIEGWGPQYAGVQVLRGSGLRGAQWIETIGVRESLGDYVPPQHRPGFRGFVEFERDLDIAIQPFELPQHDKFRRNSGLVQSVDRIILQEVRDFAESMGWGSYETEEPEQDRRSADVLERVADVFLANRSGQRATGVQWDAKLEVQAWPTPGTTRVDWGQVLTGVRAEVTHKPADARRDVAVTLFVVDPDGNRRNIEDHTKLTSAGCADVNFGDRVVVRVGTHPEQIVCPKPGKYRLGAEWREDGKTVATASQYLHVRTEPVPPPVAGTLGESHH